MMSANAINAGKHMILGGSRRHNVLRRVIPSAFKESPAPGEPVRRVKEDMGAGTAVLEAEVQPSLFSVCEDHGTCEAFEGVRSCSCCKEDVDVVKRMVMEGVELDSVDDSGHTLLYLATDCGYFELIKELADGGASIDLPSGPLQRTPMQQAARYGYISLVEFFLARGASPSATDEHGNTALALAYGSQHYDVAEILEKAARQH